MFLKKLEVYGFKSFADRLELNFSNGITAIVGPNGSGKSNVSDAVRWVLGEQSAKQLRGASMADVIFKGTDSRKPLSYCEVSLIFDNTDKGVNLDYTEVVITRRLYRNGDSEYYINRNGCRLKDIVSLFQDTGIGKEGYSIIGQGKIENILSGKQEDRRSVFEEAAGIVKYKTRKIEAERKLEHTSDNLLRINDIVETLSDRVEPLAEQAEVAKEYLSLHEQLRSVEVNYFLIQNSIADEKRKSFQEQIDQIDEACAEKQAQVEKLTAENESLDEQLAQIEDELNKTRSALLDLTADKEKSVGRAHVFEERIQNLQAQLLRLQTELESNDKRRQSMLDAMNGDTGAEEEKEKNIAEEKEKIASLEKDLAQRDGMLAEENRALEKLKADMIQNMNRLSDVRSNSSRYDAMQKSALQRQERIALMRQQLSVQMTGVEDALAEQRSDTEEYDNRKNALQNKKDALKKQWQQLYVERDEASEKLSQAEHQISAAQSRLRVLEDLKKDFEGFNFSVKRILSAGELDLALKSHISGVVAQLISVPEQFETAIEAALGNAMQNIVTPTEEDAKELIVFLRRTDGGRATFLPISAVHGRIMDDRERALCKTGGSFGCACDLISYDSTYSGVMQSLLGRTVVVENLDVGIAIARKTGHSLKIVTLQGDVMNAGGSMSGGSQKQKTSSILGREREIVTLQEQIKTSKETIVAIRSGVENFSQRCKELEDGIAQVDSELHALDVQFAHDFEKLNALKTDLENFQKTDAELVTENEQLNDTLAEIGHELERMTQLAGSAESVQTETQATIQSRQHEYNKKLLERERTAEQLSDLKIQCAGLEKELDAMKSNAARMGELIANLENAKVKLVAEVKQNETLLQQAQTELQESLSGTEKTQDEILSFTDREKQQTAVRDGLMAKSKENSENRRIFEQDIYTAGERKHKIELSLTKLENDLSYLENRIWEEYELTLASAEEFRDPAFKMTGAQTEINRLKKAVAALGNVNVNAIQEYVDTKEKLDELMRQRDDLQKAEDDLKKIIQELTGKMDKQFKEQFELINKYFTKTFSALFGGGKAELKLENGENSLESDIEIVAQPPGKSLQLLSLLSGGERALTAIAILFAMLQLKPTPFCILDEIEAALDEANVGNFASYLRKFSTDTQFIVITHRKPTMEEADSLYGVAMEEKGVSKIVSVKLT